MRPALTVQRLPFRPRAVSLLDVVEHIAPDRMADWLSELLDALRPDLRFDSAIGDDATDPIADAYRQGVFPASVVTDTDFGAINAWLRTLDRTGRGD